MGLAVPVECIGVDMTAVERLPGVGDQCIECSKDILIDDVSP